MDYQDQLNDPRWKEKRRLILIRDKHVCQLCGYKNFPRVHHKRYIKGLMAWEYKDNDLITVCKLCHYKIHKSDLKDKEIEKTKIKYVIDKI